MRQERWIPRVALMAMAAMLIVAIPLVLAPKTRANGGWVTVYLGYLPEVSNWGRYEATGQAYVNVGEGRVHIVVDHMIYDPAIRYEVWLIRADDRDALYSMGTFEVDSTGHADIELVNPDLKQAEFRFLVISAEPSGDDDPRPGTRRSIAGVFPNAQVRASPGGTIGFGGIWTQSPDNVAGSDSGDSSEGAATGAGGEALNRPTGGIVSAPPPRLPVTGGNPPLPLRPQRFAAALTVVVGGMSIGLMVAGAHRQRAAARALREASKGEAR